MLCEMDAALLCHTLATALSATGVRHHTSVHCMTVPHLPPWCMACRCSVVSFQEAQWGRALCLHIPHKGSSGLLLPHMNSTQTWYLPVCLLQ